MRQRKNNNTNIWCKLWKKIQNLKVIKCELQDYLNEYYNVKERRLTTYIAYICQFELLLFNTTFNNISVILCQDSFISDGKENCWQMTHKKDK